MNSYRDLTDFNTTRDRRSRCKFEEIGNYNKRYVYYHQIVFCGIFDLVKWSDLAAYVSSALPHGVYPSCMLSKFKIRFLSATICDDGADISKRLPVIADDPVSLWRFYSNLRNVSLHSTAQNPLVIPSLLNVTAGSRYFDNDNSGWHNSDYTAN